MKLDVRIVAAAATLCAVQANAEERMCDFPVVDGATMTPEQFKTEFMDTSRPVLIKNAMKRWPAMQSWSFDNLANVFPPHILFRVGPGPYPTTEYTMPEYVKMLNEWDPETGAECPGVFQYGQVPTSWTLWAQKDFCAPYVATLYPNSKPIHHNVSFACEFMQHIRVPEFLVGADEEPVPPVQISHSGLLIGGAHSGIDYHKHQDAINAVVVGEKHWFMKVPKSVVENYGSLEPLIPSLVREECRVDSSSCGDDDSLRKASELKQRREKQFGHLAQLLHTEQMTEEEDRETEYLECIQRAGEVVYIPMHVQHGVLNTEATIAMQMQWDRYHWDNPNQREELKRLLLDAAKIDYVY